MGVVYLAHNKLMGRDEVLKVMGRHIMERPVALERFLREIQAVARLRHPNIVTAYHATRFGESIVFAMEYVAGYDLSRLVKGHGPLPIREACYFAHQAALGLQHAHEEGLVHRDIKPGNLMLSRKGDKPTVKVLDFGLAKATREEKVDSRLTSEGQALGTPDFIAPEQIRDAMSADIRADIYSLGGTLYYLLSGRPPFQADSVYDIYQAHIAQAAALLNFVRPEIPAELASLVAKMLAKDPRRRFQQPKNVSQALAPFFKSTSLGSAGSRLELSQADRSIAVREAGAPISVSIPPARDVAPARAPAAEKRTEAADRNASRETTMELQKLEIASEVPAPARFSGPSLRSLRAKWPIVTAACVLGIAVLGVLSFLPKHEPQRAADNGRTEPRVERSKVPETEARDNDRAPLIAEIPKPPVTIDQPVVTPSKASTTLANGGATYGLRFDPDQKSFVRNNKLAYDGSHPITLEAYVRTLTPPDSSARTLAAIISNASESGMGLFIGFDGDAAGWASTTGLWHGIKSWGSVIGMRAHLAEVLSDRHLSLFVNGKQVSSFNLPGEFKSSPLPFALGGTVNAVGGATRLFNGIIEQVRISSSARYRGDFEPAQRLEPDASTLLDYQFDRDTTDWAIDRSGRGNNALILGAGIGSAD